MGRLTWIMAVICALTLGGCMSTPVQAPAAASTSAMSSAPPEQKFLFSWGMFGDPVFDRDVETFSQAFSAAYGTPTEQARYGANSSRLETPSIPRIEADLARLAAAATDGEDLIVVMLTSHGAPDSIAVQLEQNGPVAGLSADGLAQLLSPLAADQQILILQACFSGSLIDELQSPNRIILTAAAADRPSFGCNPDSDNTWFIKALNQALSEGGSWQQIFTRTRALVTQDEVAQGMPPSNPQRFVGANMRDIWTRGAI